MKNRKQRVFINNTYSDYSSIECGVPQGSILGPLSFLVYINYLRNCLTYTKSYLYADDTVLVESCIDLYTSHLHLQSDLDNIANWSKGNKLTINIKKNKSMIFRTQNGIKNVNLPDLKLDGETIEYVKQYKYLGITLNSTLSFKSQIQNTIKIVAHKISLLQKIRHFITRDAAITLYKTMILPYLDYGDVILHELSNNLLGKFQKLQERALKICIKPHVFTPAPIMERNCCCSMH